MSDVRFLLFVPETVEHMGRATPNEVRQLLANAHVTTDNPASPNSARGERRLLICRTDGGRSLHYSSAPKPVIGEGDVAATASLEELPNAAGLEPRSNPSRALHSGSITQVRASRSRAVSSGPGGPA